VVESRPSKPLVAGSIPVSRSTEYNGGSPPSTEEIGRIGGRIAVGLRTATGFRFCRKAGVDNLELI
jgi:hypothetical protein